MVRRLHTKVKCLLFILLNIIIISNGMAQNQQKIEGNWQGIFQLRFVFKISADTDGTLTATFDSPDQASVNVPVSKVTFINDTLYIAIDFAGLTFVGTMNYDKEVIQGQFSQYGLSYPMELKRLEHPLLYMAPRLTASGERQLDYSYRIPEQCDDGWETADMSAAGIDEHKINELMHDVLNEQYQNVHSILVVKNGKLVIEEYFYGFHRHKKHGIHSVTKSILSALFGIAMDRQLITDLDENIQDYFPEYADVLNQGAKSQITLRHTLTMTAGFEYDEDSYSFFDDRNSHVAMDKSGNPIRYTFESPLQNQPGEKFNYNSGLSITLGEIIKRASSLPADKFAEKYLFGPLGISDYYWAMYPDSTVQTGGGLKMLPRDMAKFGWLYLKEGKFHEEQIVSEEWVRKSTRRYEVCGNTPYGYHWWQINYNIHDRLIESFSALGRGGQFIYVFPTLDIVVVATAGNEFDKHEANKIFGMISQHILPAAVTPELMKQHPEICKKMVQLDSLNWEPIFPAELGCIKGCLNYLEIPITDAWLYGSTGYAFIINIHERVISFSVGVWNKEQVFELGKNIGFETEHIWGRKSPEDFEMKQQQAWDRIRASINNGLPCYGYPFHSIPEHYIVYGYDECGYYYKGVECESGAGPKFWKELGKSSDDYFEIHFIKPYEAAPDKKTIKDALQFAVEYSKSPEKWIYPRYKSGPAGYDLWIKALEQGNADAFGTAFNAQVWSECRSYAVPFLNKAKSRLPVEYHSIFDEAIGHYQVASENLNRVADLFPCFSVTEEQRVLNVKDKKLCNEAIEHLKAAQKAETAGLEFLERIVERL